MCQVIRVSFVLAPFMSKKARLHAAMQHAYVSGCIVLGNALYADYKQASKAFMLYGPSYL